MGPDAAELIKELRASHERVAGLVAKLGDEELRRPSYDTEWAVSQLLSHLGSGAEIALRRMEAAISGSPPLEQDDFRVIWDRWDGLEPEPVAAAMVEANEACVRRFETLDEATVRDLRLPFFAGGPARPTPRPSPRPSPRWPPSWATARCWSGRPTRSGGWRSTSPASSPGSAGSTPAASRI